MVLDNFHDSTARLNHQVGVAAAHRDVGNVGAPDLVRGTDDAFAEQVRIDFVLVAFAGKTGARLAVNGLDAHQFHQPTDLAAAQLNAVFDLEQVADLAGAPGWMFLFDPEDRAFDLVRQPVGLSVGRSTAIVQTVKPAVPVAV